MSLKSKGKKKEINKKVSGVFCKLTRCAEALQQQVQKLLVDVLADVDLRGEQDCPCVRNRQVLTAHGKWKELLWYFRHLVWMQSQKKKKLHAGASATFQ